MATLIPSSDRPAIKAQVLAIARGLLRELGNAAAIEALKISASLERDLGLGSIERVELISRIERKLGASLPENAAAEANSLEDLVTAVAGKTTTGGEQMPQIAAGDQRVLEELPGIPDGASGASRAIASAVPGVETCYAESRGFWRFLEIIYGIYAATVFVIWLIFTWLLLLIMPAGRAAARMSSVALRIYFKVIGCRIRMEGREHLEAYGTSIYVSNHTSYSDVLVVMALFPTNYHFIAKSEINNMLFIGTFLRKLGHFAFDRSKLRARSKQAEQMEKALLRGESVFVFAEGTFTSAPGVRPFQLVAFRAAVKTGRPIIPVALRGARRFLRDGTWLPRPSRIDVIVSPALLPRPESPGGEWAEVIRLRDETRRIISLHSREPLLRSAGAAWVADQPSSS